MFNDVLLPIDLNHPESWSKSLPLAAKMAGKGGTVHVLGIVHDLGSAMVANFLPADFEKKAIARMKDELEAFKAEHMPEGVRADTHVGHGHVPETILKIAGNVGADLIVMASHPPGDLGTLLVGSNADRVVRHAHLPVLVVR
ncbi:universal stress protein [Rhodobacteraceae bacterium CCMM004]|nr:universal stress protein [Rhodobacteraceae bacterium CCMM004]